MSKRKMHPDAPGAAASADAPAPPVVIKPYDPNAAKEQVAFVAEVGRADEREEIVVPLPTVPPKAALTVVSEAMAIVEAGCARGHVWHIQRGVLQAGALCHCGKALKEITWEDKHGYHSTVSE